jgi:hypothetical protein
LVWQLDLLPSIAVEMLVICIQIRNKTYINEIPLLNGTHGGLLWALSSMRHRNGHFHLWHSFVRTSSSEQFPHYLTGDRE